MRASMRNLVLLALLTTGCAGSMTSARRTGEEAFDTRRAEIQGTLVEARHYFETGAIGDDHTYCAYCSALDELPLGVLTADGTLVMLTSRPSRLAAHVTKTVRITGKLTANGQLLVPSSLRVKNGSAWTAAGL
jgi:hypothetical protein